MPYTIRYAQEVDAHLRSLTARQRAIVFEGIRRHLTLTPLAETRNRKPMRPNPIASWELRLGRLRVYYDVSTESDEIVSGPVNLQRIEVDQSEPAIRRSLKKARPNPLLITKKGKPHAILVPIPNTDLETASLSLNPNFLAILERSRRSLAEQGGISADEMEARFNQT